MHFEPWLKDLVIWSHKQRSAETNLPCDGANFVFILSREDAQVDVDFI